MPHVLVAPRKPLQTSVAALVYDGLWVRVFCPDSAWAILSGLGIHRVGFVSSGDRLPGFEVLVAAVFAAALTWLLTYLATSATFKTHRFWSRRLVDVSRSGRLRRANAPRSVG